jgi:hypothetical protein
MKSFVPPLLFVLAAPFAPGQQATNDPFELLNARAAYQQQLKAAAEPIKVRYAAYLETLKKTLGAKGEVNAALAVQREIDSLGLPVVPQIKSHDGDKLVIWNTNNGGKGDRGARKVNIAVYANGRETWHLNGHSIKWEPQAQTKTEIALPAVPIDKVRIEITALENNRGGLAEVEYIRDGQNIALKRPVQTSAVWENDASRQGDKLTDGDTVSSWLLPDKKTGWAEISLK